MRYRITRRNERRYLNERAREREERIRSRWHGEVPEHQRKTERDLSRLFH